MPSKVNMKLEDENIDKKGKKIEKKTHIENVFNM